MTTTTQPARRLVLLLALAALAAGGCFLAYQRLQSQIQALGALEQLQPLLWQLLLLCAALSAALGASVALALRRRPAARAPRAEEPTEQRQAEALVSAQRDLARISSAVSSAEEAWPMCVAIASRVSGMESGGVYLFDADQQDLRLVYHHGLSDALARRVAAVSTGAPGSQPTLTDGPLFVSEAELAGCDVNESDGLRSVAIIPVSHQGRVLGALAMASRAQPEVAPSARHALAAIADEIGTIVAFLQVEASLRESERRTRELLATLEAEQLRFATVEATVPGAICAFMLPPEGPLRVPYATKAFEDLYGLTLADVAENIDALTARVPPDVQAELQRAVGESARTLEPWRQEYPYRHPSKGEIWLEGYSVPVREQDGTIIWYGVTIDVTTRRRAEEQLRQSEVRFRALIEHAPGAITLLSGDGRLAYVSPSTTDVMGYAPEEMVGTDPADVTHPEDLPGLLGILVPLMQTPGHVARAEYRVRHKDGSWRWVESTISNLLHEPSVGAVAFNFQDISERRQAANALRASEEMYRGLMESLDSVVALVDEDGTFLYMNDVAARQLGGAPQQLIGRTMSELFPPAVAEVQLAGVRSALQADQPRSREIQSLVQGQLRWYRSTIIPIHDEAGRATHALINATDIHELKAAHQELQELNRTLEERVAQRTAEVQDLYENAPAGYHSLDAEGRFVRINQTELDWLGYTRAELMGQALTAILTSESAERFQSNFPTLRERGLIVGVELDLRRKDGSIVSGLFSATAIYDGDGRYVMSRSTAVDITQRKRAEAALRESEAQNVLLFEEAPDAVVLFNAEGRVIRQNRAFERMTGCSAEELSGRRLDELGLMTQEDAQQIEAELAEALHYGSFTTVGMKLRPAVGRPRDVSARMFALQFQGTRHFLAALRDITAEKQAEDALLLANAELARAARAKDEFLANMSHELRTPLNAILGFSEALQEQIHGPLNPRQLARLGNIEASAHHLLALITDILDLSKVEAGQLELRFEPVPVLELCQSSMLFVKEAALKKALTLGFHLDDQMAAITADPKRLKQILVNLLSNAVKFTPDHGAVRLDVRTDAEAGEIRFAVEDTGVGIAPEDMPRLFKPFVQLDSSLSRQHEGTGLGLALVHHLVEQHGGGVTVESELDKGSRFTVALPYRPLAPAPARPAGAPLTPAAQPSAHAGARILLAEDNEANIATLEDYLSIKGYQVTVARNGREALDRAAAARPDLILMDIQMPEIDGLEAIRRLRAIPETGEIPIIALTALAMPGDRERCLAAGADAYLTKPASLRGLVEEIEQQLRATRSAGAGPRGPAL